ncbi:MAG: endonuclease III [Candidatus Cloacimonetes bacterium]|nr:endonuclease III [Candidatus Cloacimonadota bacterium]
MEFMTDIKEVYLILGLEFAKSAAPVIDLIKIQTNDPFQILVGTILSARTKDQTTSQAINRLFKRISGAKELQKLTISEIEELIYPVGFYHNKAKSLKKLPEVLFSRFNGEVPETIEELLELPGVGRKTANLVRTIAFEKDGMCVDVHVHRISNRLGYIKTSSPFESEMALREKLPRELWSMYNSYLVSFGQNTCSPRNPHCDICPIYDHCKRIDVVTKYVKEQSK